MKQIKRRILSMCMALVMVLTMAMAHGTVVRADGSTLTLELGWADASFKLIQVKTNVLSSDVVGKSFTSYDNQCSIDETGSTQNVGWFGMDDVDGKYTITLHYNNDISAGDKFVLNKGSVFGFISKSDENTIVKYELDKTYTIVYDGTIFYLEDTAQTTEPTELTFNYRWGTAGLIQYNTNLPSDITVENFITDANGCEVLQEGKIVGWVGMDNVEGTIVLTFHFNDNDNFVKGQSYTVKKDSIFGFKNTDVKYKLKEDVTLYFNGTDWQATEVEDESTTPEETTTAHTCKYETKVVKATPNVAGKITEECACGKVKSTTVIPAASKVELNKTAVIYNNKTQKVTVTVKDSTGKVIDASQYSVSGTTSAKKVGSYNVTITFKGDKYTGTKNLTWNINPKTTKISSVKAGKKCLTVKWKKQTAETKGYKIQVSTDKNFKKNVKTVVVKKNKTVSTKIKGLKKNKKYYVRICTFNGKCVSSWTKYKKNVKVK